jgi:hypothetical protein
MTISIDPLVAGATFLMAIGLTYLGWKQIDSLKQQIKQASGQIERLDKSTLLTEKSSRAELIVRLDTLYEDMMDGRQDACTITQKCMKHYPTNPAKCYQSVASLLIKLRDSQKEADINRYFKLKKVLDFGELVGFLVLDRELLTIEDIRGIWGTSLKEWAKWFEPYIDNLHKEFPDSYILLLQLASKL